MRGQRSRRGTAPLVLLLAGLLAGCGDEGPSGPGALQVRVLPPPSVDAGAVVLQFTGPGIEGFEPAGNARVFGAPHPTVPNQHRVVVVVDRGDLVFRIRLEDRASRPEVAIVQAVDRDNQPVTALSAFVVRFSR